MIWQVEVIGELAIEGIIGDGRVRKGETCQELSFVFTKAVVGFCEVNKGSRI